MSLFKESLLTVEGRLDAVVFECLGGVFRYEGDPCQRSLPTGRLCGVM